MARSLEELNKIYYENTESSHNKNIKNAENIRDKSNAIAQERFDANDAAITENFNTGVAEAREAYQEQREQNAVQKLVNERQLAERMANLGLTDSGLNRTQQTAVQLSYSNKLGDINIAQQKAIDTLAATMRGYKTDNELEFNESKAKNDLTYESTVAQLNSDRASKAQTWAVDARNSDIEEENARIKAQNEASEKQAAAKTTLIDIITKKDEDGEAYYNDDDVKKYIRNYIGQYGVDVDFLNHLGYENLAYEGWGYAEWAEYAKTLRDGGWTNAQIQKEFNRLKLSGLISTEYFLSTLYAPKK